jgi:nicotinamide-nucleotide amidase
MSGPRAEVLAIGDELVHGSAVDTNSAWLARQLEDLGIAVVRFTVVSDTPAELDRALGQACARADLVVATGGLGPTEDDRTRHAAAAAAGVGLAFDPASWATIEAWFAARGRAAGEDNRRQALVPAGGVALPNRWGTAPGLRLGIGRCTLFALPGVPAEMRAMFEHCVVPGLRELFAARLNPVVHRTLNVLGPTEAALGARLEDVMAAVEGPVRVGITAHFGLLRVRIAATAADRESAAAAADAMADRLRPRLGEELVYEGDQSLAERVLAELREQGATVATAESCTGGLCAKVLTDLPGASEVFVGGIVCYANRSKVRDLGVPADLIEAQGAVSEPVAAALARGAAERFGAGFGLGITGIAGPDGGTADKPVGTVCFGLHARGSTRSWRRRIAPVSREFVRERSVFEALAALLRALREDPVPGEPGPPSPAR